MRKQIAALLLSTLPMIACAELGIRTLSKTNDILQTKTKEQLAWFQGEKVERDLWVRSGTNVVTIPGNAFPILYATDSSLTNYYLWITGTVADVASAKLVFIVPQTQSALPANLYESAVVIYDGSPTGQPPALVGERTQIKVNWSPNYHGVFTGPISNLTNYPLDALTVVLPTFWSQQSTNILAVIGVNAAAFNQLATNNTLTSNRIAVAVAAATAHSDAQDVLTSNAFATAVSAEAALRAANDLATSNAFVAAVADEAALRIGSSAANSNNNVATSNHFDTAFAALALEPLWHAFQSAGGVITGALSAGSTLVNGDGWISFAPQRSNPFTQSRIAFEASPAMAKLGQIVEPNGQGPATTNWTVQFDQLGQAIGVGHQDGGIRLGASYQNGRALGGGWIQAWGAPSFYTPQSPDWLDYGGRLLGISIETNLTVAQDLWVRGRVRVGLNSWHMEPSGDVWQDSTNWFTLGSGTAQMLHVVGNFTAATIRVGSLFATSVNIPGVATGSPVYVESDPVYVAAATGLLTKVGASTLYATGTPVYTESDPVFSATLTGLLTKVGATAIYATGTPTYVESDPLFIAATASLWQAINSKATGSPLYEASGFATVNQWRADTEAVGLKATNAMPKAGGVFSGDIAVTNGGKIRLLASGSGDALQMQFSGQRGPELFWDRSPAVSFTIVTNGAASNSFRRIFNTVTPYVMWDEGNDGTNSTLDAALLGGRLWSLYATGTPIYVDAWTPVSTGYLTKVAAAALYATGTPLYVEADAAAISQVGIASNALRIALGGETTNRFSADAALSNLIFGVGAGTTSLVNSISTTANVLRVGSGMSGGLTNTSAQGFVGNGAGLTNVEAATFGGQASPWWNDASNLTNAPWALQSVFEGVQTTASLALAIAKTPTDAVARAVGNWASQQIVIVSGAASTAQTAAATAQTTGTLAFALAKQASNNAATAQAAVTGLGVFATNVDANVALSSNAFASAVTSIVANALLTSNAFTLVWSNEAITRIAADAALSGSVDTVTANLLAASNAFSALISSEGVFRIEADAALTAALLSAQADYSNLLTSVDAATLDGNSASDFTAFLAFQSWQTNVMRRVFTYPTNGQTIGTFNGVAFTNVAGTNYIAHFYENARGFGTGGWIQITGELK